MSGPDPARWRRWALFVCGWALVQFTATALVLQFMRRHLNPWTSTLSRYLVGPGGDWLRTAYLVLALGLVLFGLFVEEDETRSRPWLPKAAYVLTGGGLATAGLVTPPARIRNLMGEILFRLHLLGAGVAFLALTAVAVSSSWTGGGPFARSRMRPFARGLSGSAATLVAVYAIVSPRGGGTYEKALIILLVLWMTPRWTVAVRDRLANHE